MDWSRPQPRPRCKTLQIATIVCRVLTSNHHLSSSLSLPIVPCSPPALFPLRSPSRGVRLTTIGVDRCRLISSFLIPKACGMLHFRAGHGGFRVGILGGAASCWGRAILECWRLGAGMQADAWIEDNFVCFPFSIRAFFTGNTLVCGAFQQRLRPSPGYILERRSRISH